MALQKLWHRLLPIIVAVVVIIADQVSKFAVKDWLGSGDVPRSVALIKNVLYFTYSTNTGVAFGLFAGRAFVFLLVAVAIAVLMVFYYRFLPSDQVGMKIMLGLILGGALGNNLIDRVIRGKVIDFIDLHLWTGHNVWPVFNLADSVIVLGVLGLALLLLLQSEKKEKPFTEGVKSPESDNGV